MKVILILFAVTSFVFISVGCEDLVTPIADDDKSFYDYNAGAITFTGTHPITFLYAAPDIYDFVLTGAAQYTDSFFVDGNPIFSMYHDVSGDMFVHLSDDEVAQLANGTTMYREYVELTFTFRQDLLPTEVRKINLFFQGEYVPSFTLKKPWVMQ